jgi:hypothetical protein
MGRPSSWPRTALALAAYLADHPLVWICGLPGGAFAGVVGRIDGDTVEVTAVAGGRKRTIVLPEGWNSRKKKAPVRTKAIRDAFRFDEAGFRVSCVERRHPDEVIEIHVRYIDESSPFSSPREGRRTAGVRGEVRRSP